MRIKAIKGKQGIGTEVKDATYVEAARWGKYRGWRYVLGLTIILFSWMVVANFASAIVALALGGKEGAAALGRLDYAAFGPVGGFVVVMAGFPRGSSHCRHPHPPASSPDAHHGEEDDQLAARRSRLRGWVCAVGTARWAGAIPPLP
jgi:hypothetical protein